VTQYENYGSLEKWRSEDYKLNITKMKGKILEIETTGKSWSRDRELMWVFSVRIQALNDTVFEGEANAKSETVEGLPYKIGDDVEFEHRESNDGYPDKLKIKKEGSDNYQGGKQKGNNRSFALSYAKDLAVARMATTVTDKDDHATTKDIINQADKFVAWLDS